MLSHNINNISINTPGFSIISISPSLPYSLSPGSNVSITITVQTPNVNYNGPIAFILSLVNYFNKNKAKRVYDTVT